MQHLIDRAVEVLRAGGTLLYPTDTIWGIGCDASNAEAVEKIYTIKQRDHSKSMLILAEDRPFETGNEKIEQLLFNPERPTTVIMPYESLPQHFKPLAENLLAADGTIGVRIPQHEFCQALIKQLGHPIVSTSANFSGEPSPKSYEEISELLKAKVDYAVPNTEGIESKESKGSRILKIGADGEIIIIRD